MRTPFNGLDELSASIAMLVIGAVVFVALSAFSCSEKESSTFSTLSQAELRGPLMRLGQPPRPVSTPTPTPTPIPTPAPTPPPPSEPTREEFTALVNAAFPDDPRMGGHVVWNESLRFEDGVWQDYVYGGVWSETGDCGLMQINWYYHGDKFAAHGWTEADCFVPEKNLVIAREIYESSGCGAWSTC